MPDTVFHQMMMLRPMQAGISGYARLQGEARRQLVQIHLRGLKGGSIRAFWYAGDGLVRELGQTPANPKGEAGLYTELDTDAVAPRRLAALLITDGESRPRPLAIGLCTAQSAGSIMDAKNALLALCDRLGREAEKQLSPSPSGKEADPTPQRADRPKNGGSARQQPVKEEEPVRCAAVQETGGSPPAAPDVQQNNGACPEPLPDAGGGRATPQKKRICPCRTDKMPREVFLPAIDVHRERRRSRREQEAGPAPAKPAIPREIVAPPHVCRPAAGTCGTVSPEPRPRRESVTPAADGLPTLFWPAPFAGLAEHFDRLPPIGVLPWPGWRFVEVGTGGESLWIGIQRLGDRVERVAYALPASAPVPPGRPFRRMTAADGSQLQVLVMKP
ncbi:MAG: hypothetical protein IKK08_05010 [Clostridia bacterium]|nr:hypothetical protein [Clostridia bacterium]